MDESDIVIIIVVTTLLILLLIAGITIAVLSINKHKVQAKIDLTQAKLEYEKELRRAEGEVSEQLMEQFAQELHDNVGHTLTCMRLEFENKKLDFPEIEETIAPAESYLEEASSQLRLLSRSLNTDYVQRIGLVAAIELEIERQRQLKRMNFQWDNDRNQCTLGKDQQLIVFRIFQEIIQNALKHSRASFLQVKLEFIPEFELLIKDDGVGFDYNKVVKSSKASGLKNILKRAEMASIACTVNTSKGTGCAYKLTAKYSE